MKNIPYKWIALSCSSLGALFSVLSGTTIMVALPSIMRDLDASCNLISWMMIGYMLSLTILVPIIGRIADMYGRKNLFVKGFLVFTFASFLCGIAHSGTELLLYRILQAIGGSLLVANSTIIVSDAFPKNQLGKALGINSMIISVAAVIGPIIGGLLISTGWRNIFFMNIPIGILGSLWSHLTLKEVMTYDKKNQKIDWTGTLFFLLAMLCLLIALSFGGSFGWFSLKSIFLCTGATLFFIIFFLHQHKIEHPLLDLRILKNSFLASAFTCNLLNGIARGSLSFLLIFYFQSIKGFDPFLASLTLTPFAFAMMIISPISGHFADKYGTKQLSSFGLFISAIGLIGFMNITLTTPIPLLILWMVIIGIGSGMFFSPNTTSILRSVPDDKRGVTAGIRTMMNNAGIMISIALCMGIISTSFTPQTMQKILMGIEVNSQEIVIEKFMSSLRHVFFLSFVMSLLASIVSFLRGKEPVWKVEIAKVSNFGE